MQEPAMGTGRRILAVAGAINPETRSGVVLHLKVIPDSLQFRITLPPFAKDPLRTVCPPDAAANASPGEARGRVVGQKSQRIDRLRRRQESRRPWPMSRPGFADVRGGWRDPLHRAFRDVAGYRRKAVEALFAYAIGKRIDQ